MKLIVTTAWFLLCLSWPTVPATAQSYGVSADGSVHISGNLWVKNGQTGHKIGHQIIYPNTRKYRNEYSQTNQRQQSQQHIIQSQQRLQQVKQQALQVKQQALRLKVLRLLKNFQMDELGICRLKKTAKFTDQQLIKRYDKLRYNHKITNAIAVLGGRLPEKDEIR